MKKIILIAAIIMAAVAAKAQTNEAFASKEVELVGNVGKFFDAKNYENGVTEARRNNGATIYVGGEYTHIGGRNFVGVIANGLYDFGHGRAGASAGYFFAKDKLGNYNTAKLGGNIDVLLTRAGAYGQTSIYLGGAVGCFQIRQNELLKGDTFTFEDADKKYHATLGVYVALTRRGLFKPGRFELRVGADYLAGKSSFTAKVNGDQVYSNKKLTDKVGVTVSLRFGLCAIGKMQRIAN